MDRSMSGGMVCPMDRTPLTMAERQGIEIDYCPTCRGVWLDRGELDKIIERSAGELAAPVHAAPAPPRTGSPWDDRDRSGGDLRSHGHRKRRKSFLEELFD
jgi:Zn-finger nucleic acid-binding protein